MSDTPRTDAIPHDWPNLAMHARQLERELNALRKIVSGIATAIGNGSVVSDQASIEFMQEIPKELALYTKKLRANEMTEERAREVLGGWVTPYENLLCVKNPWINWHHKDSNLQLTGYFTANQLRAIAWWMDNMGGDR